LLPGVKEGSLAVFVSFIDEFFDFLGLVFSGEDLEIVVDDCQFACLDLRDEIEVLWGDVLFVEGACRGEFVGSFVDYIEKESRSEEIWITFGGRCHLFANDKIAFNR
jgi:hypothetical protein